MKIGFWNIAGQTNPTVKDLIYEWTTIHDLDIIVLIECKISVFDLLNSLNRGKSLIISLLPPIATVPISKFLQNWRVNFQNPLPKKDAARHEE